MLIVPIENKLDWKSHPPIITTALVLINCLIFFFYQSGDVQREQKIYDHYLESNLVKFEAEVAQSYLNENPEVFQAYFFFSESIDTILPAELARFAINYREFDQIVAAKNPVGLWEIEREKFERLRGELSAFKYGLTPSEPFTLTQLTALFMHGDFGHLLGNMIFLFIFGFGLEAAIGRLVFLLTYLVSGFGANALYISFNTDSLIPLIGASGAISGVMGMYLAVYGFRKIQFFYTLIFYADRIKAPALIVLPIFLLKELYGVFFQETNVAYWAHIGGMLTGFGMVMVLKKTVLKINWDYVEKKHEEDPLQQDIENINDAVVALNFDRAKKLCQDSLNVHPEAISIWKKWFDLCKLNPADKEFHTTTFTLLKQIKNIPQQPELLMLIEDIIVDYIAACKKARVKTPALNEAICLQLMPHFLRQRRLASAELVAELLVKQGSSHQQLPTLLESLINLLKKSEDKHRASTWTGVLQKLA